MISLNKWAAKYPFDKEAKEYLRQVALDIKEYFSDDLIHVVEYSYRRASERDVRVTWENDDLEAVSYYLAVLIVRGTDNRFIYHYFSNKESKRAYELMIRDSPENIVKLSQHLNLEVKLDNNAFAIRFLDYIKIASRFSSPSWRPYYLKVNGGYVYIPKVRLCRILTERVRDAIIDDIEKISIVPEEIKRYSERLIDSMRDILSKHEESIKITEHIKTRDHAHYPPCIRWMINNIPAGLPHMARFTLVTFMNKMGYSVDEIVNMFSRVPDFDESKTRYQVEHIMGLRGGRKVYAVPACRTLKSYNLCFPDEYCTNIKHPLQYVMRKRRSEAKRSADN